MWTTPTFFKLFTPMDRPRVQRDIDAFVEWSLANGLPLNTDKCAVISFARSPAKVVFNYTIQRSLLSKVSSVIGLGVLFNDNFSFKSHIEVALNKEISIIKRSTLDFKQTSSIIYLYKSIVLP